MKRAVALAALLACTRAWSDEVDTIDAPARPTEPAAQEKAPAVAQEALTPAEPKRPADPLVRVAATFAATLLAGALPNVLWLPFFAFNSPDWPILLVVAMALEPLALATGGWLAHRALGGKGLWAGSLIGALVGLLVGGAAVGVVATQFGSSTRNKDTFLGIATAGGTLVTGVLTVAALELSHDRNGDIDLGVSVSPVPNGAAGFVNVHF